MGSSGSLGLGMSGAAALAVVMCAAVQARDAPVHVRGTIAAVVGSNLTVKPPEGADVTVVLTPGVSIVAARKASLADVRPGTRVGIANTGADGVQDALGVHIVPEGMRLAGEGQRPWDLGRGSRMTDGVVETKTEAYDGQNLRLVYKGGASTIQASTIQVRPNTPVVIFTPGSMADLASGAAVFVPDGGGGSGGTISAGVIIVGINGAEPGM